MVQTHGDIFESVMERRLKDKQELDELMFFSWPNVKLPESAGISAGRE